jgi:ribose 5-phosphate isomerase B
MKKILTEADIIHLSKGGSKVLSISEDTIITPLAVDKLRELGITVEKKTQSFSNNKTKDLEPFDKGRKLACIGGDHTGFKAKEILKAYLKDRSYQVIDVGTLNEESCDYTDFAFEVAKKVIMKEVDFGIIIDATGIPSAITANKVPGILAATCYNEFTANSAREHNNANVLVLGAKALGDETLKSILDTWLKTKFGGGRHQRRLDKITAIEGKYLKEEARS